MIANAIGVIVAYVPEGLPLALSMGLTLIARRLCYQHSVLLKRMGTIETMGSMSLLASDKVGNYLPCMGRNAIYNRRINLTNALCVYERVHVPLFRLVP